LEIITENKVRLDENQIINFINCIFRRTQHEPFAYIVGNKEFMGFKFLVNKNVLIPRPDTEVIVEKALELIPDECKEYRCLDMCAGTGCIGISLALMRLNILVDAVDVCEKALVVLRSNIKRFKLEKRIRVIQGNLLDSYVIDKKLDLIVANPPYVSENDYLDLHPEVRNHEPKKALVAHESDSLFCHKTLLKNASDYLCDSGKLIFEFGFGQEIKLAEMSNKNFKEPIFFKDYTDVIRGCIFKK